jgi:hypothetical protein
MEYLQAWFPLTAAQNNRAAIIARRIRIFLLPASEQTQCYFGAALQCYFGGPQIVTSAPPQSGQSRRQTHACESPTLLDACRLTTEMIERNLNA